MSALFRMLVWRDRCRELRAGCSALLLLVQLWLIVSGSATEADLSMSQESEDMAQVEALHFGQNQTSSKR